MEKVIVTGSNGFIGKHLIKKLKEQHKFIIGVDVQRHNNDVDEYHSYNVLEIPESIFKDVTTVYHLAGSAEPKVCDNNPIDTINTYVTGTSKVLEMCLKYKCKVVVPSTIHVENYAGKPGDRNYSYIVSKLTVDALCYYYKNIGLDVRLVRLSNVYGPNFNENDTRVIPTLSRKIINNEHLELNDEYRSFVSIDDVIKSLIDNMVDVTLIAPEISIKELASKIENIIKCPEFDEKKL